MFRNQSHFYHIRYSPGTGSNSKAEFAGLWALLHSAINQDIQKIQIMVDSKLVIGWARKRVAMANIGLSCLLQEIHSLIQSFQWFSFTHIYKEGNQKADELSKQALLLPAGSFGWYVFWGGQEVDAKELYI